MAALEKLIQDGNEYDEVIAIGPLVMMKFVSALTKEYGIKTVVSMNPVMIDGTGMCGGCRLTVGGKTKFACVDGPEFDGHEVDFDEMFKRMGSFKDVEREEMSHLEEHVCKVEPQIKEAEAAMAETAKSAQAPMEELLDRKAPWREELRKSMQEYTDQRGEMDLQDRLLRQAAATLDYTISPEELEKSVTEQLQNMEAQLAQQGLNLQMYCQFMNTTEEQLRKDAYPAAEAAMKNLAAVDKIVELEKLEATQEELAKALAAIARNNGITVEDLKDYYDAEFEAAVMRSVLTGKVMALIRENAIVTEV